MTVHNIFELEEVEKKGTRHYNVLSNVYNAKLDRLGIDFQNLFNGNKQLGDIILKVVNENWTEFYKVLGRDYENAISLTIKALANQIFSKIPLSELFD